MSDINKDYYEFLSNHEEVPNTLAEETRQNILLTFRRRIILSKFMIYQVLGAFVTLSFCPQFGIGLAEGHGISHFFRQFGDLACATFCGSLFLSSGMFFAYIGMKGEELWWVWKNYKFSLILIPAFMWSLLMLLRLPINVPAETFSYHLVWFFAAMVTQALWLKTRSEIHQRYAFTKTS